VDVFFETRCSVSYVASRCPFLSRLCFQIQRDTGLWYSVEYSSFSLGPEADKYRLSVSGFSGDEGDALAAQPSARRIVNGMQFSTPDQKNDNKPSGQCSRTKGWWFNYCSRSTLTFNTENAVWNAYTTGLINDVISARMLVKLD